MSAFTQSIDLYAQLEPARPKPITLKYMVLGWSLILFGYLVTTLFLVNQAQSKDAEVTSKKQRNQQLQQEISQRKAEDEQIDLAQLESELKRLRQEQRRQELLVKFLSESELDQQHSFSEAMAGLARQHVPGIAIEKFTLQRFGGQVTIQGQLGCAEALPRFVQNLSREPVFNGTNFNRVVMSTTDEQLNFEMSSRLPKGRGS